MESYYKTKQKYDKKKISAIKKIYNNEDLTLEEKRKAAKNFKPQCVNCKRKVGTIFYVEQNFFKAKCGNIKSPCNLNLSTKKTQHILFTDLINTIENDISAIREIIVKTKLNFLFKYANEEETIEKFEIKKKELNMLNEHLYSLKQELKTNLNNDEKQNIIYENNNTFNEYIKQTKDNLNEYRKTKNIQYLKDNALLLKDTIMPLLDTIRKTKYDICNVESSVVNEEVFYKLYCVKDSFSKIEKEIKV